MWKLLFFFSAYLLAQAEENYYKLLNVNVDANEQTIRRAFKKLGLKYHPDKNEDNKEEAEKMFMKVANAYEVLMDSEKRKIYDKYGEAGLKKHQEQESAKKEQQIRFGDRYNQFFGGKKQKLFDDNRPNPYENTDVIIIDLANINKLFRRNEVWLINFFSAHSPHCEEIKDLWKTMAIKLAGIVKIAAIDCEEEEELCDEYSIKHFPSIMLFSDNTAEYPELYKGEKTIQAMSDFAVNKMQSFVRLVNTRNFHEFIEVDPNVAKILIFTDRKITSPQLKAFSKEFKGKVNFGEIRATETELVNKYNIKEFPTLIGLDDESEVDKFKGEQKKEEILSWINGFIEKSKSHATKIRELSRNLYITGKCSKSDKNYCFLWFIDRENSEAKHILKELANDFTNDQIDFYWVDKKRYPSFGLVFEGKIVAYRPKRKKYVQIDCEDYKCIHDKLSNILSGGGEFIHLEYIPELIESRTEL